MTPYKIYQAICLLHLRSGVERFFFSEKICKFLVQQLNLETIGITLKENVTHSITNVIQEIGY